jgi:hypothetical protein
MGTVLESARFFVEQEKLVCAICGTRNPVKDGYCQHCMAPLELSRSIAARGAPPRFLSVLGASGAGKTVYLGMLLDILSKGYRGLNGFANGPFSVAVQQETIAALQMQRFPEKTPSEADHWKWVHCEIARGDRPNDCLDLVTPDLAGEAIALEMEQPGTFETIRVLVKKSSAFVALMDSVRARDAGRDEDLFAMKLISYLSSIHAGTHKTKKRKLKMPVALVFTKADLCPEALTDPDQFAASNLPGLLRLCQRNLANYKCFSVGVVGSSASIADDHGNHVRIPLRVEPHGVVEPVEWLVQKV